MPSAAASSAAAAAAASAPSDRCSTGLTSVSGGVESQFDRLLSNVANAVQVNDGTPVGQSFSSSFLSSFGRSSSICPPPAQPSPLPISAFVSSSSSSMAAPSLSAALHFPAADRRPSKRSPPISTTITTTSRTCVDTRGSPPPDLPRHQYESTQRIHHQLLLQRVAADGSLMTASCLGGATTTSVGLDSDATSPDSGGDSLPLTPQQRSLMTADAWHDAIGAAIDAAEGDRRKSEPTTAMTSPASAVFCNGYPTRSPIAMTADGFDGIINASDTAASSDYEALTMSRRSTVEYHQSSGWCNAPSLLDPYATFT